MSERNVTIATVNYKSGGTEELSCWLIELEDDYYSFHTTDGFVHEIPCDQIRDIGSKPGGKMNLPDPVQKPPVGAIPHRIHNHKRIKELQEAITRQLDRLNCVGEEYRCSMGLVACWADEIKSLARYEKNHPGLDGMVEGKK